MSNEVETKGFSEDHEVGQNEKPRKSEMKEFLSLMMYVAGVIVLAILLNKFVIQKVEVDGPSMNTTLKTGQQLLVEKVSYHFTNPKREQIVVFTPPGYEDTLYIKRVIGLPGDKIQVKDGHIFINGTQYEDKHWREEILDPGIAEEEITVGENEYFLVGDNRNDSSDSRDFGTVSKDRIMGKAILRIWPFNKIGTLH